MMNPKTHPTKTADTPRSAGTSMRRQRMRLSSAAAAMATFAFRSAHAATTAADFSALTNFLQAFANFMTGPFGKAVVVISIIAAFCAWVFAPRDGIFGPVLRVVVAGIAIMNAAVWITQLGGGTNVNLGG